MMLMLELMLMLMPRERCYMSVFGAFGLHRVKASTHIATNTENLQ